MDWTLVSGLLAIVGLAAYVYNAGRKISSLSGSIASLKKARNRHRDAIDDLKSAEAYHRGRRDEAAVTNVRVVDRDGKDRSGQ